MTTQAITRLHVTFSFCRKRVNRQGARLLFFILSCISLVNAQTSEAKLVPLSGVSDRAMLPFGMRSSPPRIAVTVNRCPIQLTQLPPLRGFRLGASIAEFAKSFQGNLPSIPEPDDLGIRSMKFYWSQEGRRSTDLNKMEFRFFNDRLYQIEATYAVGTEWEERPLREFAAVISRGMGVEAGWAEVPSNRFKLDCGEVRFDLWIMKPIMSSSSLLAGQIATAYLTLTATGSEAQIKKREESLRQQQQQRNAERRRVFRP
jgi:hypothetical protein